MEKNIRYENFYDKEFLTKYESKNINKIEYLKEKGNEYGIKIDEREKLYDLEVYTIDPEGSLDADDGFSIEKNEENGNILLYVHIADPTEYIKLKSKLWIDICKQCYTIYPSNRDVLNLMPDEIIKKASLRENNKKYSYKNAITIKIKINEATKRIEGETEIIPSHLKIKRENSYTYEEAGEELKKGKRIFLQGVEISEKMREERGKYAIKLGEVNNAYTIFDKESKMIKLKMDTKEEVKMKQMIAEFAIISNNIIAEFIERNINEEQIYRGCELSKNNKKKIKNINGQEIIEYIVKNGIKACYNSIKIKHDLVEKDMYVHFTSPLRRVIDCVTHYILKYIIKKRSSKKIKFPFEKEMIKRIEEQSNKVNKELKKLQYNDAKYRMIQAMDNMLLTQIYDNMYKKASLQIEFKILSYSGIFLNVMVTKIEDYPVYFTMTFRKSYLDGQKINDYIKNKYILKISISQIFFHETIHDGGRFPEIEEMLNQLFETNKKKLEKHNRFI